MEYRKMVIYRPANLETGKAFKRQYAGTRMEVVVRLPGFVHVKLTDNVTKESHYLMWIPLSDLEVCPDAMAAALEKYPWRSPRVQAWVEAAAAAAGVKPWRSPADLPTDAAIALLAALENANQESSPASVKTNAGT